MRPSINSKNDSRDIRARAVPPCGARSTFSRGVGRRRVVALCIGLWFIAPEVCFASELEPAKRDILAPVSNRTAPPRVDLRRAINANGGYPLRIEQRRKLSPAERSLLRNELRESLRGVYDDSSLQRLD